MGHYYFEGGGGEELGNFPKKIPEGEKKNLCHRTLPNPAP